MSEHVKRPSMNTLITVGNCSTINETNTFLRKPGVDQREEGGPKINVAAISSATTWCRGFPLKCSNIAHLTFHLSFCMPMPDLSLSVSNVSDEYANVWLADSLFAAANNGYI